MTAVLPSTGDANWQNLVDNWTEADAEWLQDRMIQRITNASDFTFGSPGAIVGTTPGAGNVISSIAAGRLFYNTVTKNVVVSTTGANAGLKALLASSSVKVVDAGTNAEILLTSGATGTGITFAPTGITIGGPVTFTGATSLAAITGTDITASGFLSVRAGTTSGKLVTDATSVKLNTTALADTSAAVRIATTTGAVLTLNDSAGGPASLTLGGGLTAGSVTSGGAISGTSLSVGTVTATTNNLTNVTITGTTNTAAITATGTVTAANLTTAGTITGGALSISGVANFAAIPVGPVADPSTANQLTRKAYVDAQFTTPNTALVQRMKAFGLSNLLIGSGATAAGTQLLVQAGWVSVTPSAGGYFTFAYPTPFPNGVVGVQYTVSNDSGAPPIVTYVPTNGTKSVGAGLALVASGSVWNLGTFALSYLAIGW